LAIDVLERIGAFGVFEQVPKLRAWRRAMRKRKSHLLTLLQPNM
jgi:hypothetical protein